MLGPLRVNELTRLCRDRYPTGTITPDDQGRALLDAIIKHMIFFCEERIVPFAATWANWMTPEGLAKIIDEAKIERRKIYAEEAGRMVNLRCDERRRLRITTMRPADKSAAEFREWAAAWKRLGDRERQRRRRDAHKTATARRKYELSERHGTIYLCLTRRWRRAQVSSRSFAALQCLKLFRRTQL